MPERGIDIAAGRRSTSSRFAGRRFDYVITLCDRVREVCPEFPGDPSASTGASPDPARERGDRRRSYPAFERTAEEIETRIGFLLAR